MFLAADVDAALRKGPSASTCARRLVLRSTGDDGRMIVVEDVFNPQRGLFVTPDYDEAVWRTRRLDPFATVRVGAAASNGFEPVVYPGGRVDVETADGVRPGRLHAGYATLGAISLFARRAVMSGSPRSPELPRSPAPCQGGMTPCPRC